MRKILQIFNRIEAGIFLEPDRKATNDARALYHIQLDEWIYHKRTLKWFVKKFFQNQNYGMYKGSCNCKFLDFGPFYITFLGEHCYNDKLNLNKKKW